MAAWMLYSAGVAVLIACAASAAEALFRAVRLPVRGLWLGAMVTAVLLSGIALVRMQAPATAAEAGGTLMPLTLKAVESDTRGPAARALYFVAELGRDLRTAAAAGAERVYDATRSIDEGRSGILGGVWVTASIILLLFFHATLMRVSRSRRTWQQHRIDDVDVLVSPAAGPALVGLLHPVIVVPAWLLEEAADRQRLVVQHEQEHLRARDHALIALACLLTCLLPWNPALWWMLRRTRLAVELDCDARVLRRGARAHSYGSLLLDIAGRSRTRPFGAPAIADSRSHLERRIIAMTEMARTPRRARTLAAGAAALLLGLAACTADMPTAAEIDDLDAAEAQLQAEKLGFVTTPDKHAETIFYVDGVLVSEAEAKAILSDDIESVEIMKSDATPGTAGERAAKLLVRMRTEGTKIALDSSATFERRPLMKSDAAGVMLEDGEKATRESKVRLRASEMAPARTREMAPTRTRGASPLVILDGVVTSASFSINSITPESIESVEVLKGAAARALYTDARAVNGVIRITTKKGGSR